MIDQNWTLRRVVPWAALLAGASTLAIVACAGADIEPASPDDVAARGERQDYEDVPDEERSRWRWQGRRQDCFFVYDNECFGYLDEACLAAGCEEEVCTHDESAPANVTCPDED